jgi:transposase-like protein
MIKKPKTDEEAFALVLATKTRAEIARHLGIKKQNLTRWKKVPPHHAKAIAALTGLPREYVLPSLYA